MTTFDLENVDLHHKTNRMQKYCYLCRLPDRIWVLEPHPATLKWKLNVLKATTDKQVTHLQGSKTGHKIINILTFGWWVGGLARHWLLVGGISHKREKCLEPTQENPSQSNVFEPQLNLCFNIFYVFFLSFNVVKGYKHGSLKCALPCNKVQGPTSCEPFLLGCNRSYV